MTDDRMYVVRLPDREGAPPSAMLTTADPKARGKNRAIKIKMENFPTLSRLPGFVAAGYQCIHPERFWVLLNPPGNSFGILPDGSPTTLTKNDKALRKFVLENIVPLNAELTSAFGYLRLVLQP